MRNIFVFGSNRAGRHGAGSAKEARLKHGAIYGQGEGLQGESYGIPTKGFTLKKLPLGEIGMHVMTFIRFAESSPQLKFHIVKIGCGLAGYREQDIAPLFALAPDNCVLPDGWEDYRA